MVKSFIGAMRSSFYIIDKDNIGETLQADMWDDGWSTEKTTMPRKKLKIKLVTSEMFWGKNSVIIGLFLLLIEYYRMNMKLCLQLSGIEYKRYAGVVKRNKVNIINTFLS